MMDIPSLAVTGSSAYTHPCSWSPRVTVLSVSIFVFVLYLISIEPSTVNYLDETTTLGSRLATPQPHSDVVGPVTGGQQQYLPHHPAKIGDFSYMVRDYISPIYVPYETIVNNVSASPFEMRWPGDRVLKDERKIDTMAWSQVPKGKHICFVSVGKAAGSSVSGLLGFQLHAPDEYFIPDGVLPQYTTHMFHGSLNDCADDTPYYLYTLRNPFTRAQSAFAYDRDTYKSDFKPIDQKCGFETLNMLAEDGLAEDGDASFKCKHLAHDLMRGSGYMFGYHLFCNYHYYLNITTATARHPETSKILAIRSEHMQDDWNSAERVVGDDKHVNVDLNIPHLNVKDKKEEDKILSEKAQVLVCDALCEEIQVYKRILREAVNLSKDDYAQSIAELQEYCPLQTRLDSCRAV